MLNWPIFTEFLLNLPYAIRTNNLQLQSCHQWKILPLICIVRDESKISMNPLTYQLGHHDNCRPTGSLIPANGFAELVSVRFQLWFNKTLHSPLTTIHYTPVNLRELRIRSVKLTWKSVHQGLRYDSLQQSQPSLVTTNHHCYFWRQRACSVTTAIMH